MAGNPGYKKRTRAIAALASQYGRRVELHKGHFHLVAEGKPLITASGSPKSFDTWLKQVERDLRRYDK